MIIKYVLITGILLALLTFGNNLLLNSVDAQICRSSDPNDLDGDSIPNNWEVYGADVNGDGQMELNSTSLGLNPLHKNVFLEVDYMENRRPIQKALNNLVTVFDHAPLCNPDGIYGITLNIQVDDEVPYSEISDVSTAKQIKSEFLGTASDRNSTNSENIIKAKEALFYYGLFADKHPHGWSGEADGIPNKLEPSTKTFIVTLGDCCWAVDPSTGLRVGNIDQQSGTVGHEFGHALGLSHGGSDHSLYKPNYLSVMNYAFQVSSYLANRSLDYSRCEVLGLNESALDETSGIGKSCPPGLWTIVYASDIQNRNTCDEPPRMVPMGIGIDWNGDTYVNATDVDRDLNCDGQFDNLSTTDDWNSLVFPLKYVPNSSASGGLAATAGLGSSSNLSTRESGKGELTWQMVESHIAAVANDTVKSIGSIAIRENQLVGQAGLGGETINVTALEAVKNDSMSIIGSTNATQLPSTLSERSNLTESNGSALMESSLKVDNATVVELIAAGRPNSALEMLNNVQMNIDSNFSSLSDVDRVASGEALAQEKIENLKGIIQMQKWP